MKHESPKKSGKQYDAGSILLIIVIFLLLGGIVCIAFDAIVFCFIFVVLAFVIGLLAQGV